MLHKYGIEGKKKGVDIIQALVGLPLFHIKIWIPNGCAQQTAISVVANEPWSWMLSPLLSNLNSSIDNISRLCLWHDLSVWICSPKINPTCPSCLRRHSVLRNMKNRFFHFFCSVSRNNRVSLKAMYTANELVYTFWLHLSYGLLVISCRSKMIVCLLKCNKY